MSISFIILIITGGLIYNTYHDNFFIKNFQSYKKYYKMVVIAIFGLGLFAVSRKNPMGNLDTLNKVKNFVGVLPIDKNSKNILSSFNDPITRSIERINNSGKNSNKRSVSEVKKKLVASNQGWKCGKCKEQLTAWFEVDHTQRLDRGGTNDINNLVALCRNCHGEKTFKENI
jgi:5-methylcytosine-specific restriction endonuclease McrA